MTSYRNQILVGDCIEQMQALPAGLFHCVVTSPPYFALRSYLPKDHPDKHREIGSEPTPEAFVATMVKVFRGVRRILRDDGVLWVNLGDSFSGSGKYSQNSPSNMNGSKQSTNPHSAGKRTRTDLNDGNQILIPHRVALALQANGWVLRQTIIWSKASPMPESLSGWRWRKCRVKVANGMAPKWSRSGECETKLDKEGPMKPEKLAHWSPCPGCPKCEPNGGYVLRRGKWRTTASFEYLFMLTKGGDYFADGDAVCEQATCKPPGNKDMGKYADYLEIDSTQRRQTGKANGALSMAVETRNPRSVLTFPGEPFKGQHFATYPSSLPAFCIKASTSKAGCCGECGACFAPVVESERVPTRPGLDTKCDAKGWEALNLPVLPDRLDANVIGNRDPQRHVARTTVTGYRPTCGCQAASEPCRVFDPFTGSGSTQRAAEWLGRDWCGTELNPVYAAMARKRIKRPPKWALPEGAKPRLEMPEQRSLFPDQPERAAIGGGA